MEYIAQKTFERNGVLYQNGDVMPELDSATVAHYSRYGMIAPAETKPVEPNGSTAGTTPQETKPAEPKEPGKKGQNKKGAADADGADQSVADGTSVSETGVNQG